MKDASSTLELCPFCGKSFKRLKSHLPHCKAASNKKELAPDRKKNEAIFSPPTGKKTKSKKNIHVDQELGERSNVGTGKGNRQPKKFVLEDKKSPPVSVKMNKTIINIPQFTATDQQRNIINKVYSAQDLRDHSTKNSLANILTGSNVILKQPEKLQTVAAPKTPILPNSPVNTDAQELVLDNKEIIRADKILQDHQGMFQPITAIVATDIDKPFKISRNESCAREDRWNASKTVVWDHIKDCLFEKHQQFSDIRLFNTNTSQIFGSTSRTCNIPLAKGYIECIQGCSDIHNKNNMDEVKMSSPENHSVTNQVSPSRPPYDKGVCSQGFQWIPELYTNYLSLRLLPGKLDLKDLERRVIESDTSGIPLSDVPLEARSLMDTRLGELPSWLAKHRLSAKTFPRIVQKAWGRYYEKYINVRRGGMGGLAMVLFGYCVLSYGWNYNHIKQDRWRRYH
ncbi:uncharacterized protein C17orf80 homolog isoform X2 [Bombina bombina]|uniref:uncharacterized protein C17orf80 homolog isoform X2 n=1 Tax=Bombina bombina TaxID=8345 RepID=UPI00235B1247|nr:uncharacterized protein C17orf80 homolog isoform X2 [Bombina bombina]